MEIGEQMKEFNMFKNTTTEKLPCWKCKNYREGKCPIFIAFVEAILTIPLKYRMQLDKIQFKCKEYKKIKR